MTYAVAHSAIRVHFETEWASRTALWLPKTKFEKPDANFVRLNIDPASSFWASMGDPGNNVERNLGQVTVQIFALSGRGEGEGLALIDATRGILRGWTDQASGVRFEVPPYAQPVGTSGKWDQTNVIAPFRFDDHA